MRPMTIEIAPIKGEVGPAGHRKRGGLGIRTARKPQAPCGVDHHVAAEVPFLAADVAQEIKGCSIGAQSARKGILEPVVSQVRAHDDGECRFRRPGSTGQERPHFAVDNKIRSRVALRTPDVPFIEGLRAVGADFGHKSVEPTVVRQIRSRDGEEGGLGGLRAAGHIAIAHGIDRSTVAEIIHIAADVAR